MKKDRYIWRQKRPDAGFEPHEPLTRRSIVDGAWREVRSVAAPAIVVAIPTCGFHWMA